MEESRSMPPPRPTSINVSVVAPFYNERDNLEELIHATRAAMDSQNQTWEFLLVDDGSTDGGGQLVTNLCYNDPRTRLVSLARRAGQSGALWAGLQECRGSVVVTLDADLQNPPGEIPRLVQTLLDNSVELVAGVRAKRRDSLARRLASRIANAIRRAALGDPFTDSGCSLRAYRREVLRGIPCFSSMHRFLPILAVWNGAQAMQIEVEHSPRQHGISKYSALRGRAATGAFDLLGMLWLSRRWVRSPTARREKAPETTNRPPSKDPNVLAQLIGADARLRNPT